MTIPLAHGDIEGWVLTSAKKLRTSWVAPSAFSGDFHEHRRGGVLPLAVHPPGALLIYIYQNQLYISRKGRRIQ